MAYQYVTPSASSGQATAARPAFDLDDLLDLRPPADRAPAGAPMPPPSYPPPPVNDDPYGFNANMRAAPQPTQPTSFQPSQPLQSVAYTPQPLPQQQQLYNNTAPPVQPAPYTYASGSQMPIPQQPPAVSSGSQSAPALQAPYGYYGPPPGMHSQQAVYGTSAYSYPAPQTAPVLASQPLQSGAGSVSAPQQPAAYPQQQQVVPTTNMGATEFRPSWGNAYATPEPTQSAAPLGVSAALPAGAASAVASDDDADRLQLEKIIRLRKELEREQEREKQKREERETWACAECTFRNKLTATSCEMCTAARPGSVVAPLPQAPTRPPATSAPAASTAALSAGGIPVGSRWQCSVCGTANVYQNANCSACSAYRSNGTPLPGPAANGAETVAAQQQQQTPAYTGTVRPSAAVAASQQVQQWECNVCTLVNPISVAVCSACESGQRPRHMSPQPQQSSAPLATAPPPGTVPLLPAVVALQSWACSRCTFENQHSAASCNMCGQARPGGPPMTHSLPPYARQGGAVQTPQQPSYPYAAAVAGAQRPSPSQATPVVPQDDDDAVQWQQDNAVANCNKCNVQFGMLKRRHHCRACGFVFCYDCCNKKVALKPGAQPVKVCTDCAKEKTR